MLEGMRRASQNWLGKSIIGIMFGFLIISFAVWGIGDIFRGFGVNTVAKVGGVEITSEAYRAAYQMQLQNWQRESRRAITNEQARAAGLDRMVLSRLISDAALDQRAKALGLAMAERDIAQVIVNDPAFVGPTGKFDRQRFNDALRDAGYGSEQRFVQEQRQTYLRRELALSVAGDAPVPKSLLEAAHRYGWETRSVEFVALPESFAGEIPPAGDDALSAFFESRKAAFRAPEYRRIVTLAVTPTGLSDPSKVSDADAMQAYEQTKGQRFTTPERRTVQQIVFPNEADAAAALKKIKDGATFEAVATERGLSDKDIALGTLALRDFADPLIAQAAFGLADGGVSEPVKSQFGFTLVRVAKIEPQTARAFEEVAPSIKQDIADRRSRDEVLKLHDQIEDGRTSGKPLAEAAKAAGLEAVSIDAVDQNGRDRNGADVPGLPEREQLLRAAFASDIGVDNDVITSRDNGYVWFEVAGVDPARDHTLDEVRERVSAAWRAEEITRILQEKAAELVKRINAGESVEDVAKSIGLTAQVAADVKRTGSQTLPPGVVARVFAVAVGASGSVSDGAGRIVFKVLDANVPPYDADEDGIKALAPRLREAMTEDILAQYIARVQDDLGVTINEAAVRTAVGGGDAN